MLRTMSCAIGCDERMNDSLQQVHSRPCSQSTGRRGLVSSALRRPSGRSARARRPIAAAVVAQKAGSGGHPGERGRERERTGAGGGRGGENGGRGEGRGGGGGRLRAEVAASGLRGRGGRRSRPPASGTWRRRPAPTASSWSPTAANTNRAATRTACWSSATRTRCSRGSRSPASPPAPRTATLYLIEDMHCRSGRASKRRCSEAADAGLLPFPIEIGTRPHHLRRRRRDRRARSRSKGAGRPSRGKKPPFPGQAGLFGKPTTVNNVETLAHVAWIARHGAAAFADIGTKESKGTLLFTLGREVARPGVHELPFGSHLARTDRAPRRRPVLRPHVARDPAGDVVRLPARRAPRRADRLRDTAPARHLARLRRRAARHSTTTDVVAMTLGIAEFFMQEQCGQCPPCRMETNQFVHILKAVQAGKGPGYDEKLTQARRLLAQEGLLLADRDGGGTRCSARSTCSPPTSRAAAGPGALPGATHWTW